MRRSSRADSISAAPLRDFVAGLLAPDPDPPPDADPTAPPDDFVPSPCPIVPLLRVPLVLPPLLMLALVRVTVLALARRPPAWWARPPAMAPTGAAYARTRLSTTTRLSARGYRRRPSRRTGPKERDEAPRAEETRTPRRGRGAGRFGCPRRVVILVGETVLGGNHRGGREPGAERWVGHGGRGARNLKSSSMQFL